MDRLGASSLLSAANVLLQARLGSLTMKQMVQLCHRQQQQQQQQRWRMVHSSRWVQLRAHLPL
jgi:hypothetical protein